MFVHETALFIFPSANIIVIPLTLSSLQVSSLVAGQLESGAGDALFIGTSTDLHAYDVDKNRDLFYKDVCLLHHQLVAYLQNI